MKKQSILLKVVSIIIMISGAISIIVGVLAAFVGGIMALYSRTEEFGDVVLKKMSEYPPETIEFLLRELKSSLGVNFTFWDFVMMLMWGILIAGILAIIFGVLSVIGADAGLKAARGEKVQKAFVWGIILVILSVATTWLLGIFGESQSIVKFIISLILPGLYLFAVVRQKKAIRDTGKG